MSSQDSQTIMLIIVCHHVIICLSFFRFMDSDHLFGIFKHFKHSELSVFSVLDLGLYSKQLNNCHSSVIIQTKYNISINQLFTVFVKHANISQIIQYIPRSGIDDLSQV
jgi:hypothetical protein